jgi:hypothetical protein
MVFTRHCEHVLMHHGLTNNTSRHTQTHTHRHTRTHTHTHTNTHPHIHTRTSSKTILLCRNCHSGFVSKAAKRWFPRDHPHTHTLTHNPSKTNTCPDIVSTYQRNHAKHEQLWSGRPERAHHIDKWSCNITKCLPCLAMFFINGSTP